MPSANGSPGCERTPTIFWLRNEEFRLCIEIYDCEDGSGPKSEALLDQAWTLARENKRDQALTDGT